MLTVVPDENEANQHTPAGVGGSMLDELAREGARRMLAAALQAEVAAYIEQHADQVDEHGHRRQHRECVVVHHSSTIRPNWPSAPAAGLVRSASTWPDSSNFIRSVPITDKSLAGLMATR